MLIALLSAAWGALTSRLAGPIAAGIAALLALALAGALTVSHQRRDALAQAQAAITTPVTGWAARLATCQANATTLEGQLSDQSKAVRDQAAAQDAKLAEARGLAAQAEAGRKRSQALADQLAAYRTPAGADACADLKAADAAVLESFR